MIDNTVDEKSPSLTKSQENKPLKILANNYQNNLNSDYTEKIEELDKNFNYSSNNNHYWSNPELSLLYGTPIYEAASPSQKIALNHLAWVAEYDYTADSETEATHYNQITAGSFYPVGGDYEMIAHQLDHETLQERSHIHAFYKVNYQTIKALLGKQAFINPLKKKSSHQNSWQRKQFSTYQSSTLRFLTKMMLQGKEQYYSQYLKKLEAENKPITTSTTGFFHGVRGELPKSWQQFFAFNWGSSPFLACNYYTLRYMANLLLKNHEHKIAMYYKKLYKQGEFLPVPTAISHYHFLDEAFHTTTSLFLGRELYKHLPKPTAYEKFVLNLAVYMAQLNNFNLMSGIMTNGFFKDDLPLMGYIYKVLQSPLFNMSTKEALEWMEKSLCHEHEGLYVNLRYHHSLLSDLCRFCDSIEHLWPINREMRIMASGGSISKVIKNNINTFKKFTRFVANENN
jgi:hypothetical protein